ncbi:MAG TPA: glycosyl hydrolase [Phycisphaerae bacterium]|nr:glycosyl hydrolase [Phycisphaerae bacterium]
MQKRYAVALLATLCAATAFAADSPSTPARQPWQVITTPTVAQAAASFANPPAEYGAIHWAIWSVESKDRIAADIQHVHDNGGSVYMINNSRGLTPRYFTPEYLDLVKFAVQQCKALGMKVWIEGDAGYPDGFAGGMISQQFPQLGMQGIIPDARYSIPAGQTVTIQLPPDTLGIISTQEPAAEAPTPAPAQNPIEIPIPPDGHLKYTCPSGGGSLDIHFVGSPGDPRFSIVPGQTLSLPVSPGTQRIEAAPRPRGPAGPRNENAKQEVVPLPENNQLKLTAPADSALSLTLVRHVYRSSPTRFTNRADGTNDKDSLYSLIDYLDPNATDTYLHLIYDQYEKIVGDEFGKTVLGFRGDETDFTGFDPYTPKLLETFKAEKGYDLTPWIPQFFETNPSEDARRAKADYWDVWSGMFRDNFYKRMQDWCEKRGMQFMVHLNHEELQVNPRGEDMIKNEGSFFRDMRYVGVPGVDNLNQIRPGIVADFPKLAASAAHLFGRPLVWDEEGGATGRSGKFVVDYQLVRGINFMNIRGMQSAPNPNDLQSPGDATGHYVSRAQHLLALGTPIAKIALFHADDSYWLGGPEAVDEDATQLKLTTELLEHQRDFDHIDADTLADSQSFSSIGDYQHAYLLNASGNSYQAVIIPSCTVIQKPVLEKLQAFAKFGGKVIFIGHTPTMVVDKTFLHPEASPPDLSFATLLEPTPELTDKVLAALPAPDVKLDQPCPPIKYIHRSLKDGDVYFFFNESDQPQSRNVTLAGAGTPQLWDPSIGQIEPLANFSHTADSTTLPITLQGQESRFIVLSPQPNSAAQADVKMTLDGDWTISLNDKSLTSPLKSWQDLSLDAGATPVHYHKTFTPPANLPPNVPLFLDLGTVNEVARVTINGHALPPRSWAPFQWNVTPDLKPGDNTLDIDVQVPATGFGRGNFGGGAGNRAGRAGRGARGNRAGNATAPGRNAARGPAAPAAPTPSGLLGPVRIITQ